MRALEAQALRTQSVINQTAAASQRVASAGTGASGGILSSAGLGALSNPLNGLLNQYNRLGIRVEAIKRLGGDASRELQRMGVVAEQVALVGGPAFANFGREQRAAAQGALRLRGELDSSSAAFQRHAHRVSETILLYAAFTAAATAAVSAVSLATTIDREARRLEAVLNLTPAQGKDFIAGVGQVAISSVTPFEELLAQEDLIASAFAKTEDPIKRQAQALELTNDVGRITTVTQRDVATETQNLIAIMQQAGLPVEALGDKLGKVTVAGNNSSTSIAAILDALQVATPAARLAGVGFDELITLIGLFREQTQRGGTEIGNTFKTLFQTITQPEAQKRLKEITDGLVDVRDAEGNIRPVLDILVQLRTLIDSGAIASTKLNDIFKSLAPPLNPGAAQDIKIIFDTLSDLPDAFRQVDAAGEDALQSLVDKINNALGPQFAKFIEEVKVGFNDLFGEEIIGTGQTLLNFLRTLGDVLNALPDEVVVAVGQFLALTAALKGVSFIAGALVPLLGLGGITTAISTASAAAAASGVSLGIVERGLVGISAAAKAAIPLLLTFAAIQAVGGAFETEDKKKALQSLGISEDTANAVFLPPTLSPSLFGIKDPLAEGFRQTATGLSENQRQNLDRLSQAALASQQAGTSTPESLQAMRDAVVDLHGAISEELVSIEDIIAAGTGLTASNEEQATSIDALYEKYLSAAEGLSAMTAEERLAAEAATIATSLNDDMAKTLEQLTDRFRKGKITAEEYAAGQAQVARASELAAQLVAAAGDQLAQIPELTAAAAEGNDALASAIFEMITKSGDQLPVIDQLITRILGVAAAAEGAAAIAAANPIIIRTIILEPQTATGSLAGGGFFEGTDRGQAGMGSAFNVTGNTATTSTAGIASQINSLINGLFSVLNSGTSAPLGFTPSLSTSGAGTAPAPNIFDIGDFPEEDLAKAIALALRLQGSIPGADAAAKDEILNIIGDAEFLRQVKGLDDELLRKAIEELTDIERARLELEKANANILSNVVVNQGPLSSLVSQPTIFGVGGSIVNGNGLNFDPSNGSITINVGGITTTSNLTPAQLQAQIYDAISRALRDALRT